MRFPVPERPTSEMSTCLYTSQMCVSRSAFKFYIQKSCFRQRENSFLCMKYIKSLRRVMIMQKNSPVPNSRSMIRECTHTCQRNYFKNHDCKIHYLLLSNVSVRQTHTLLGTTTTYGKRNTTGPELHCGNLFHTDFTNTSLRGFGILGTSDKLEIPKPRTAVFILNYFSMLTVYRVTMMSV